MVFEEDSNFSPYWLEAFKAAGLHGSLEMYIQENSDKYHCLITAAEGILHHVLHKKVNSQTT